MATNAKTVVSGLKLLRHSGRQRSSQLVIDLTGDPFHERAVARGQDRPVSRIGRSLRSDESRAAFIWSAGHANG